MFVQGLEPDALDGECGLVVDIELAADLGVSHA